MNYGGDTCKIGFVNRFRAVGAICFSRTEVLVSSVYGPGECVCHLGQ